MWFAAAGLALSALSAGSAAGTQKNQQRVSAANQYQQTLIGYERELKGIQQGLTQQQQRNTAIAKADIQSLVNTNFTAGLLNLQRSMQKKQTASDIQRLGETKLQALASAEVSAAATGSIGASVNAVASDISMKVGEARIEAQEQDEMNTFSLQTQIRNLYQGFMDTQQVIDESTPDIPGMPPKTGAVSTSAGSAAAGAAIGYAGNYLNNYLSMASGGGGITGNGFFQGSLSMDLNTTTMGSVSSSFTL